MAAGRFAEAHDRCISQLVLFPESGQAESENRYSLPVVGFGYRIVYGFNDGSLVIINLENLRRRAHPL